MLRTNFLICIAALTLSVSSFAQNPINLNPIVVVIKDAANADQVSNQDLGKWYSIYKGMYFYGTKFQFEGCNDFGDVEQKLIKCRDKILPEKTKTFGVEINKVTSKYKDLDFNDTNKDKFLEDLNLISEGVKAAVD